MQMKENKTISLKVDAKFKDLFQEFCDSQHRSMSGMIRFLIEQEMERVKLNEKE